VAAPLQLVPRIAENKPPPPVPDELLSDVDQVISDVEELPPDATQPLEGSGLEPPPPPRELPEGATELMPSLPQPAPRFKILEEPAEPTSSLQLQRRNRAALYLIALTGLGLLLGSGGGYLLLEHMRQPPPPLSEHIDKPEEAPPPPVTAAPPAPQPPPPAPPPPVKTPVSVPDRSAEKAAEERLAAQKAAEEKGTAEQRIREAEERRNAAEAAARKDPKVATAAVGEAGGCPAGMRFVAAGAFKIGTPKDDPMMGFDEKPLRSLDVAAYCIDMYEYPNRRGAAPSVNISWSDAKRVCESKGKRLCSEDEWEKACKGSGNSRFPYGNQFDANACNTQDETGEDRVLSVSGRFGRCHSSYGVADMSGNVAEWTSTPYAGNADMTQKGGSFGRPDYAARCSARKNAPPGARSQEVGFRCCGAPQ
jgi:formylglycine-generating enzyme required for sulfatase activity